MEQRLYDILILATIAHEGQVRKGSGEPYITHPISVAQILNQFGYYDFDFQATALCHDIIEDCEEYFANELETRYYSIHKLVTYLTNKEEFKDTCENLKRAPETCQIVKCADIIHNTSDDVMSKSYIKKKLVQLTYLNKIYETIIWQFAVQQIQENL